MEKELAARSICSSLSISGNEYLTSVITDGDGEEEVVVVLIACVGHSNVKHSSIVSVRAREISSFGVSLRM